MDMDKTRVFERAADILEEIGYDSSFRQDYSGRGMYGATIQAISTSCSGALVGWAVTVAATELYECEPCDVREILPTSEDSMGLGSIYY